MKASMENQYIIKVELSQDELIKIAEKMKRRMEEILLGENRMVHEICTPGMKVQFLIPYDKSGAT